MANEQNLRPGEYKFTEEDHKKGAQKSAEVRRERSSIKAALLRLLSEDIEIDGVRMPAAEAIALAQLKKAAAGDRKSAEYVRDSSGQKPAAVVEIAGADQSAAAAVEALIKGDNA